MGGWFSEEVWVVGEVDHRILQFDRPWFRSVNLGLRYPRILAAVPDDGKTLHQLMDYSPPTTPPIHWFYADNGNTIPSYKEIMDVHSDRRALIVALRTWRSTVTGALSSAAHIERWHTAPLTKPYPLK